VAWKRDYRLVAGARAVSLFGSSITLVAMPILVYTETGSATLTSLLTAMEILPYLLFGTLAGVTADRGNRRAILMTIDVINGLLLMSIPLAGFLAEVTLAHVFVVAIIVATTTVWFDAASFAVLPRIVPRSELTRATSHIFSMNSVAMIAGPAVGGGLVGVFGAPYALVVDSLTFLTSCALIGLVATKLNANTADTHASTGNQGAGRDVLTGSDAPVDAEQPAGGSCDTWWARTRADIAEGFGFIFTNPVLRSATVIAVGISATGGAVLALNVVLMIEGLGLGREDPRIGVLLASGAVGVLAATLLLPVAAQRWPAGRVTVVGLALCTLAVPLYAYSPAYGVALVAYLLFQLLYMLVNTNGFTLRQYLTPDELQGRVNMYARMITMSGQPLGAVLGGLLADAVGVRSALLVMTVPILLSAVAAWSGPLRTDQTRIA
jgi:MFS family permease